MARGIELNRSSRGEKERGLRALLPGLPTQSQTRIIFTHQGEISRVGPDKFSGRIDAAVSTRSTPDVPAAIPQAGLGRHYSGGRREKLVLVDG